jgi:hypothetical protein
LSSILLWLSLAVDGRRAGDRLAVPLIVLILRRIRSIGQRFARLATCVAEGRVFPRRRTSTALRQTAERPPRPPSPLPQGFAWLVKLMPEAAAAGTQLQCLFAEPEMAALLAAAPAPMARALRPLCWMLGVTPPPILAAPARPLPAPPQAAQEAGRRAPSQRRQQPLPPHTTAPPLAPATPHACGPPLPRPA